MTRYVVPSGNGPAGVTVPETIAGSVTVQFRLSTWPALSTSITVG